MAASRATFLAIATLVLAAIGCGSARAQTPGLVVDADTGRVLFAERATDPWFPASITKLMTTYVALDQVRQGRASMNGLLTMSETAAAQPPSKLGMRPGQTMTLENALKIIMVLSANDVAQMIGENLGGGSVEGFSDLMNDTARRLGMRESRWVNQHGLPDARQQTSARDMAVLARALMAHFPEHEALFHIGALKLGNRIMRNHNGLLGRYPGTDGMKTGFICSGGFNVVATSTQNGRRLIAVVMGFPSARERDLRTADLFDSGFASLGWGSQSLDTLPPSGSMAAPDMRQSICGPKRRQPQENDEQTSAQAGNADNPIASLFSPSAFGQGVAGAAATGSRRTLGPRVAFEPIPVWLGATPGSVASDEGQVKGQRTRAAGNRGRTKVVASPGPATAAFTSSAGTPSPIASGIGADKANPVAASAGAAGRRKLGAIPDRPKTAAALEGMNPDAGKPKPKAAAKPAPKVKPVPAAAAAGNAAAKTAARAKPAPAGRD
ncbi:D-alanyl-D-alanine carboxypeptidase family protein [uncultured Enterovirga sp.]|uniref:D-alanyl-D-alanine carboxypeptidase family protein n=1 Tax=uncultured Enterovirga sp. TaxID=2026352 RepID=UPI0035CA063B